MIPFYGSLTIYTSGGRILHVSTGFVCTEQILQSCTHCTVFCCNECHQAFFFRWQRFLMTLKISFCHFSYWRSSVSYRGLLHCVAVPRKLGLGGKPNCMERESPLKKETLMCQRTIISCVCNQAQVIFHCATEYALQVERTENGMCETEGICQ